MSQEVARAVRLAGLPALVTNDTWRLAPWADVLYAADHAWWSVHPESLAFAGLKVTAGDVPIAGVLDLRITGCEGFDPNPECIRTGGNGGYAAVHIAAQGGGRRILLCGFDMHGGHWHPDHKRPLRNPPPQTFKRWIQRFETLAHELERRGIEVLNCTSNSAMRCFPMARLEDALEACAESAA
jgi:hypothetical protein